MKRVVAIVVLALLAPLMVAAAGCSGGGDQEAAAPPPGETGSAGKGMAIGGATGAAGGESAPVEVEATSPMPAQEDTVVSQPVSSSLPSFGPKVIQTASLRVVVPRGRFDEAIERARTIAAGLGGFVVASTASQGAGERLVRGTLVVRVPDESYAQAMARLGRLGKVEGREESGQDVSAEFVDLEARARHLEAVERQLLELLERAQSVAAALAVQSQLNGVQLELEQVRGRLRYLDDQVSYSTISLDMRERTAVVAAAKDDDGWGIVEAWSDGARAFVRVAGGAFVGLAAAAPILLIIAALLLAGRFALVRSRRRVHSAPEAR